MDMEMKHRLARGTPVKLHNGNPIRMKGLGYGLA